MAGNRSLYPLCDAFLSTNSRKGVEGGRTSWEWNKIMGMTSAFGSFRSQKEISNPFISLNSLDVAKNSTFPSIQIYLYEYFT